MFRKMIPALLACLSLMLFACDNSSSDKKSADAGKPEVKAVKLNFSHTMAPNSVSDMAAKKFREIVEKKSNGTISVNVVTNCGLSGGDLTKALEMTSAGDIDIHACAPTNAANFDPRFYVFWMPFLFPTTDSLLKVTSNADVLNEVNGWTGKLDMKLLGISNAGARQISNSKKPIATPQDLKGMNIRVPGAQLFIDCYRDSFGSNPTAMDFSEVYTALQQGTIDGQENPVSVFDSSKFNEVQKHLTLWDYVRDTTGWFMSQKSFDKLTPEQQTALIESAAEALQWSNDYVATNEAAILKKIQEKGVTVTTLTAEQQKAFADACAPLYAKYAETIGKPVIELFQKAGK